MKQKLVAYLFQSDGHVIEMPTDELLGKLEQIKQTAVAEKQNTSPDKVAFSMFLQTLKWTMQTCRFTEPFE
jgi:hypothetical protein